MTGTLSVSVSYWPAHALITVAGECDITTAPQLLAALREQTARDEPLVIVDLSALRFLDAAGIHTLLATHGALARRGRSLALASPQRIVTRVLELTQASWLIPVYPDAAQALAADQRP